MRSTQSCPLLTDAWELFAIPGIVQVCVSYRNYRAFSCQESDHSHVQYCTRVVLVLLEILDEKLNSCNIDTLLR